MDRYNLEVVVEKEGEMVFFSAIDLGHILERALRRSMLPVCYTQGFNPRVKLSFASALKVGVAGSVGATLYFTAPVTSVDVHARLNAQLPEGLRIRFP